MNNNNKWIKKQKKIRSQKVTYFLKQSISRKIILVSSVRKRRENSIIYVSSRETFFYVYLLKKKLLESDHGKEFFRFIWKKKKQTFILNVRSRQICWFLRKKGHNFVHYVQSRRNLFELILWKQRKISIITTDEGELFFRFILQVRSGRWIFTFNKNKKKRNSYFLDKWNTIKIMATRIIKFGIDDMNNCYL